MLYINGHIIFLPRPWSHSHVINTIHWPSPPIKRQSWDFSSSANKWNSIKRGRRCRHSRQVVVKSILWNLNNLILSTFHLNISFTISSSFQYFFFQLQFLALICFVAFVCYVCVCVGLWGDGCGCGGVWMCVCVK